MSSTWKYILIGTVGLILGAVANYITNKITNRKLKEELLAELQQYIHKQQVSRLSSEEENKIKNIQAQLEILNR